MQKVIVRVSEQLSAGLFKDVGYLTEEAYGNLCRENPERTYRVDWVATERELKMYEDAVWQGD